MAFMMDISGASKSSQQLKNESLRHTADAIVKRGEGNQMMGAFNMATSLGNAIWNQSITKRNSKIAENNARRIEAERAFVLSGMRKQMSETEKKQRRNLAEIRSKFIVSRSKGVGTKDYVTARVAQMENAIQLHRIASENKVREADFDYQNRAYDARLKGANQRIAGARRTTAHLMQAGQQLFPALDDSYKDAADSVLSMQENVLVKEYNVPLQQKKPALQLTLDADDNSLV